MAKDCTISLTRATEDATTKDSEGDWDEFDAGNKGWSVSCSAFVGLDSDATANIYSDLLTLFNGNDPVFLKWDVTNGTKNRTATTSAIGRKGSAWFTKCDITAANRSKVEGSFEFQGTGAISALS